MHASAVLHRFIVAQIPSIHARRLRALCDAVHAAMCAPALSLSALGRHLPGNAFAKHKIKRVDRLLGNGLLGRERVTFYRALTQHLLRSVPQPLILIDWSDLCADRSQQLLRAVIPLTGRPMLLYEEVHPLRHLGNRYVQHHFLHRLSRMLPPHVRPIIVADAGFRVPFYREVERLGWHWLGRIRGRDYIAWPHAPTAWLPARTLFALARRTAHRFGPALWVRNHPFAAILHLVAPPRRGRIDKTASGGRRRSHSSLRAAAGAREPWLLVCSLSLSHCSAKRIARYYAQRMQIEQGFRDTKNARVGLGLTSARTHSMERRANLLLIAALAVFVLYQIGLWAEQQRLHRRWQVNTLSTRRVYSLVFLAIQLVRCREPLLRMPDPKLLCSAIEAFYNELHAT